MVNVRSARVRPTRRRNLRLVEAAVADDSGPMKAVWFNQTYLAERLRPGTRLLLNGKLDRSGFRVATHEVVSGGRAGVGAGRDPHHRDRPRPQRQRQALGQPAARVGVAGARPGRRRDRAAAGRAARPPRARGRGRRAALRPLSRLADEARAARDRLAFEELCLHQAALAMRRGANRDGRPARRDRAHGRAGRALARLAAVRAHGRPAAGVRGRSTPTSPAGRPMQRLLMGEVGSGKTVVAVYAMLRALAAGHQAAMMAPTETLAEQHAATLGTLLGGRGDPVRAAHRGDAGGPAARDARPPAHRRARARDRHPRAARARRRVRAARGLRGRRAAPLRRAPARGARRKGRADDRPAHPAHDRDPDPAHALADRLRRPRRDRRSASCPRGAGR